MCAFDSGRNQGSDDQNLIDTYTNQSEQQLYGTCPAGGLYISQMAVAVQLTLSQEEAVQRMYGGPALYGLASSWTQMQGGRIGMVCCVQLL